VPGRPIASTPDKAIPLTSRPGRGSGPPIRIFFFGGARAVTGSMYVIEAAGRRILLECGLFQAGASATNRTATSRSIPGIDAIVCLTPTSITRGRPLTRGAGVPRPIYATRNARATFAP
jgi:metallo-beta-lactamase family protein